MKKGWCLFLIICFVQMKAFAQSDSINGFVDGWNFAQEVKKKILNIRENLDFKSFTVSTQNARDDIYNLLTNQLVQRANVFTITNSFEIATVKPLKGSDNNTVLPLEVIETVEGAGNNICYSRGQYSANTEIEFYFSTDFQNNRVYVKPSYNLSNFSADPCFSPGEKYTSSVSSFRREYESYIQEIESYYTRQFEIVVTYSSDTFNANDRNLEQTFRKALSFDSYGYSRDDLDRDIENFQKNLAKEDSERIRLVNERERKAQEEKDNEVKLRDLEAKVLAASKLNNPSLTLRALVTYRDHKKMMGLSTQFNDIKIIEIKDQIKADYEQFLSDAKTALENKKYQQALGILNEAKALKDDNPDIYLGSDFDINYPVEKAEEEIAKDREALEKSAALVVDDNFNLSYEEYILERAIGLEPDNASFKSKLEQVKLRLQVVPILESGDELLAEDDITGAIVTYRSAMDIMPGLELTQNKIRSAEQQLAAKSDSKYQLLDDIRTELSKTDDFDDAAKVDAKDRVLAYIKDFPGDVPLMVAATDLILQEKLGLEDAYMLADQVSKIEPENVANLENLGEIFYQNNQMDESMAVFQQAWDLGRTDDPNMLKRLSQGNYTLYLRTKNDQYAQNALRAARRAQELGLDDPVFARVITNLN